MSRPSAGAYPPPDQRYGRNPLGSNPLGSNPLGSLTRAEQVICGRLILRQLDRAPRIQQELRKYGPEGTVRLCSARAFGIFEIVFGVVAAALFVSGEGRVAAFRDPVLAGFRASNNAPHIWRKSREEVAVCGFGRFEG